MREMRYGDSLDGFIKKRYDIKAWRSVGENFNLTAVFVQLTAGVPIRKKDERNVFQ